ncbi:ATP-binding protein [Vulgatibacter sp.]|uniref:sensor histidine kinase n=1 Tax=Vulgatibacter sp. TaxID=1971226 RepID=UPI00356459E3
MDASFSGLDVGAVCPDVEAEARSPGVADEDAADLLRQARETEAILETIVRDAPIGIAFLDRELRYRVVNEALASINGLPAQEHLGRSLREVLPEIPTEPIERLARQVMASGKPLVGLEVEGATPAAPRQRRHWVEHWYPARVGDEVIGIAALVQDVTEQRRSERARSMLLGVLGHDLRNPRGAIRISAALLASRTDDPTQIARAAGRIEAAALRMDAMISDLIDFARGNLGGAAIPLTRRQADPAAIAAVMVEEHALLAGGEPVQLTCSGDATGAWDETRLCQLIGNLLSNAHRHGAPPYSLAVHAGEASVSIEMTNGGKPIPAEEQPHLFEPFRQGAQAQGREGLGLGLYIVSEIVRAHGGTIAVRSDENATCFSIALPRRPA